MHVYCSHVTCIYVHQYTSQYGNMVSGMVEMCALMHMYSPIGFVPYSMQADSKTILSHDQMMQDTHASVKTSRGNSQKKKRLSSL